MRTLTQLLAFGAVCAISSQAIADSAACDCPVQAAMKKLPTLTFAVGGECTSCEKHAADLAKSNEADVQFVVKQSFENAAEAQTALLSATEALVTAVATPSKCCACGTTTVAGKSIQCDKTAAETAQRVKDAIATVKVSYKVGDKECDCPNQAKELSKKSGHDIVFVVNGKESNCEGSCQLNQARAKYEAAIKAAHTTTKTVVAKSKKAECSQCPVQAAMKNLPRLTYQVGAETTECDKHAAELSKASDSPIRYVVHRTYASKQAATVALADATEALVNKFATPVKCSTSGTTTVAGTKHTCCDAAAKTAEAIQTAMKTVEVSYKVGDEQCNCPNKAKALAKESGKSVVFVLNGKETHCPVSSRLEVARAKYKAAVEAVAKLNR